MRTRMYSLMLAMTGVFIARIAVAEPELKGTPAELAAYLGQVPKTVAIAGESELKRQADKAVVTLRVKTEHRTLQDALRANQHLRSRLFKLLDERGIPSDRIQAARFSSAPRHGVFTDKVRSYSVENVVRVTVQDEKEFQSVGEAADAWPEVAFEGVEFEHSNKDELKRQAITRACEDAEAKRRVYEQALGVQLKPVRFVEASGSPDASANRPAYREPASPYDSAKRSGPSAAPMPETFETMSGFGELTFKTRVIVEYTLERR